MAEIINLRRARKAKARHAAESEAEANRRKFGQSKAERGKEEAEAGIADRKLDAHRLDRPDES